MILGSAIDCLCRYFLFFSPSSLFCFYLFRQMLVLSLWCLCFFYIFQILLLLWHLTANYLLYRRRTPLFTGSTVKISVHWSSSFFFQIRTWLENGITIAGWVCLRNPSGRWRMRGLRRSNLRKWSKRQVVHLWQLSSSVRYFFFLRSWKSILRSYTPFSSWRESYFEEFLGP